MNKFLTAGVAVAVVLSGLAFFGIEDGLDGRDGRDGRTGAQVGPDHYDTQYFQAGAVFGGKVATSSGEDATVTVDARVIDQDLSYVSYTPNIDQTITTQASTSAPFRNLKVGESFSQLFYNASTSASATITFAAGTGIDLQEDEGETVVLNGLEVARLTYVKKADTDIIMWVEAGQVGD